MSPPEDERRLRDYLAFAEERPERFRTPDGGVEIVTEPARIRAVEGSMGRRYAEKGWRAEWAQVGVWYRDPYITVLRDAVIFPDGTEGVHHRILRTRDAEPSGVAVLPVSEGRILLLRHFRHPTRQWHWEIPRGAIEAGATPEQTIATELSEEAQATVVDVRPLGAMYGATSMLGLKVLLYAAELRSYGEPARGEGVTGVRLVEVAEFEAMVRRSEITDAFTLGAFLHARLGGLV